MRFSLWRLTISVFILCILCFKLLLFRVFFLIGKYFGLFISMESLLSLYSSFFILLQKKHYEICLNHTPFNSGLANMIKLAKDEKPIKYKIYKSKKNSFYLFSFDEIVLEFILKVV